ncbi:response regulator [Vogesella sp. LIG4]|uniref:ATP-binding response regulator n=1 Tax=Vogesella sp. LIG4 TaxID=1192162 RepID=UPI00082020C3|nr:response regulator [Vogesella sp. LIG4]SCK17254.1 Response regulator containing CheY-like receiver, AAA-type ATPase, and DNA-binding domains [Vogesella sp. LIG4]
MAKRLLLVDDEPFNLELLGELLQDAGYETVAADNGEDAWQILQREGEQYAAVLLDKMMPGISGFELLRRMKANPHLAFLPVIMQTAVGAAASVQEGLSSGAFYYLTKPFSRDMLLAVVAAATVHWDRHQYFRELANQQMGALQFLDRAEFSFHTLQEARHVAALLAKTSPEPEKVATGLFELIVNAIEHGNLGVSFEEKTRLQQQERWEQELERRLADPVLGARKVSLGLERSARALSFEIRDQGDGFDWQHFLTREPGELLASHGRGIMIARRLSFDELEYRERGNVVRAVSYLPAA